MNTCRRPPSSVSTFGTAQAGRLPALDGLRGLAIALVMLNHFTWFGGMQPTTSVERLYFTIATAGWIGVDLFFVLSGFLITGILVDSKHRQDYFRNFYIRRTLRIFPLYYGVLLVFFVVLPRVLPLSEHHQALVADQVWYWTYTSNVSVALGGWPQAIDLSPFWSLAVEEQFYLVWPVIVFWLSRRHLLIACIGCIVTALAFRLYLVSTEYWLAAYVLTPARMDALATGAVLALVARGYRGGLQAHFRITAIVGFATALLLIAGTAWLRELNSEDPRVLGAGLTVLALFFGAVLALSVTASPGTLLHRWLTSPVLVMLGRYSYALYAFHLPVALLLSARVFSVPSVVLAGGSQLAGQALFIVAAGGVSLAMAALSWHLFESRILALKRLFPYGGDDGALPSASPAPGRMVGSTEARVHAPHF